MSNQTVLAITKAPKPKNYGGGESFSRGEADFFSTVIAVVFILWILKRLWHHVINSDGYGTLDDE